MESTVRYPVPETRMPFVNAEIAPVDIRGVPHLVSSIWGGHDNGRLYFWNPESGAHFMRRLPSPIPGAYMLKAGLDGTLYLGCGNGDLLRYDGASDVFETLVSGHLHGLTWGGAVTDRHVFWNAFQGDCNGSVAVYDIKQQRVVRTFAPMDPRNPPGLYGHHATVAPDGHIIWHLDVPSARIVVLDPVTMERRVIDRPWLESARTSTSAFIAPDRLALFTSNGAYLVRYPEFELEHPFDAPPECIANGHNYPVVVGGFLYVACPARYDLWRMNIATLEWECAAGNWSQGEQVILAVWQNRDVCAVTVSGTALRFDPATGQVSTLDLQATGTLPAHAFCAIPEQQMVVGAPFINQRFWTLDLKSGEGRDRGRAAPGGGQINQILWDHLTRRALLSSYTSASVTAFDPGSEGLWPDNPQLLASASDQGQMRPTAFVHDGRHLWMGTNPKSGTLGGALSRIDPRSGEIRVWPHLVPDQTVAYLALDRPRHRLYLSTSIHADCHSAPPTAETAVLAVFDMDRLEITTILAGDPPVPSIHLMASLPDGRALFWKEGTLMAWDPEPGTVEPWGRAPERCHGLLVSPDGGVIAHTADSIGVMLPNEVDGLYSYEPRIQEGSRLVQLTGENLYYAAGLELVRIPLSVLS